MRTSHRSRCWRRRCPTSAGDDFDEILKALSRLGAESKFPQDAGQVPVPMAAAQQAGEVKYHPSQRTLCKPGFHKKNVTDRRLSKNPRAISKCLHPHGRVRLI